MDGLYISREDARELIQRCQMAEAVFIEILRVMQENDAEINRLRRIIADYERSRRGYIIVGGDDAVVEV